MVKPTETSHIPRIAGVAICLNDNTEVEINEEMKGWEPLMRKLPEYLPGCKEFDEWFDVVAQPPFKENLTVI